MMYTYVEQRPGVQGRRRSAHRPARLAGHEQRRELAHAGRHARAPHDARGGRGSRQPVLQRQQEQAATRRRTASSRTSGFTLTPFSWGYLKTNIGVGRVHEPGPDAAPSRERVRGHRQRHSRHQRRHHAQPQRADAVQRQRASSSARVCRSAASSATRSRHRSRRWTARRAPTSSIRISSRSTTRRRSTSRTVITQRRLVSALRPGDARASGTTCT